MKTVILALVVLVVVSQSEALTCHCSSIPAICPGSVVTCELGEVCGSIAVGVGPRPYHVRKCMKADECMRLSNAGGAYSDGCCCSRDMCN